MISLACRAQRLKPLMLCDDYNARVTAKNHDVEPLSVHKLLHLMITQGKVTAAEAASFADGCGSTGVTKFRAACLVKAYMLVTVRV